MMTPEQLTELRNGVMDQEADAAASPSELDRLRRQIGYAQKIADKIDEALGMEKSTEPPVSRLEAQICGLFGCARKGEAV